MQIFVKDNATASDKTITLDVERLDLVESVKEKINSRLDIHPGKVITLGVFVHMDDGISLKEQIFSKESCPLEQQRLIFNGILLKDDCTLYSQGVRKGSTLHLILGPPLRSGPPPLDQIFVKTSTGETISLKVDPLNRINDVKQEIEDKLGFDVEHQKLGFDGEELDDDSTLSSLKLIRGSILDLEIVSVKKHKREEEVAVRQISVEFIKVVGEKLGEKMFVVDAVDMGAEGDYLTMLRASAAVAMECRVEDVGEMTSKLRGDASFTVLTEASDVKRLRSNAEVRVVVRDAKDAEIDRLRAEKLQLEQQAQQHINSGNSCGGSGTSQQQSRSAVLPPPFITCEVTAVHCYRKSV